MEDKELDSILDEIKRHSDDGTKPEDSLPAAAKPAEEPAEISEAPAIEDIPEVEEAPAVEEAPEIPEEDVVSPTEVLSEEDFSFTEEPVAEAAEEAPAEAEETAEEIPEAEEPAEPELDLFAAARAEEIPAEEGNGEKPPMDTKKKIIIALVAAILVLAIGAGVYFGLFFNKNDEPVTSEPLTEATTEATTAPPVVENINPLTGEAGFNKKAIGKRPIAVVVENEYGSSDYCQQSRPQWGLDSADMVMEGETEFSTRMLFFWADYTAVAEKVGPARSARPPFIRFAELFDGIFIHAGLSHSKGAYVGADSVFKSDNVDHVNLLQASSEYSGDDKSRPTQEHQHYFKGKSAPALIKAQGFRTKAKQERYTQFKFNTEVQDLSDKKAETVKIKWSNSGRKTGTFTYDKKSGKYTSTDYNSSYGSVDVAFENIIVIFDTTEYIVKQNYKGAGNTETYCNYKLTGGNGMVASNGTYVEITWKVVDGKIVLTKTDGSEAVLNPGKVYIAYASSNHNGSYTVE